MSAPADRHPDEHLSCPRPRPLVVADESGRVVAAVPSRRRRYAPLAPYVCLRRRTYHARVHVPGLGSVNLGQYDTPEHASTVAAAFVRLGGMLSAEHYLRAGDELVRRGLARDDLLPRWVYRASRGRYGARRTTAAGEVRQLRRTYDTPAAAFRAMLRQVGETPAGSGRHWRDARAIARRHRSGERLAAIAAGYGVSAMTISRVVCAVRASV